MSAAAREIATLALAALLGTACGAAQPRPPMMQAAAKTQPPAKQKQSALRGECVAAVGFCVSVPNGWKRIGDIFDDLGFVAAEAHPGADPGSWPQLTVVVFEPPAEAGAASDSAQSQAPSLDVLVDRMLTPTGALASAQTLSRSRTMVNGAPAEIVRVQFPGQAGKGAIEEVALIEGEDDLIYSVALRCAPQDFNRLDAVFQQAIQSWRIRPLAATHAKTPGGAPHKQSSTPEATQPAQPKQDSARP